MNRFWWLVVTLSGCFPDPPIPSATSDTEDAGGGGADLDSIEASGDLGSDDSVEVDPDGGVPGDAGTDSATAPDGEDGEATAPADTADADQTEVVQPTDTSVDAAEIEEVVQTGCAAPGAEGQPCDDGDPCTVVDRCSGGVCVAGSRPDDTAGDWVHAFSHGQLTPTSVVVDRAGSAVISGFASGGAVSIETTRGRLEIPADLSVDRVFAVRVASGGLATSSGIHLAGQLSQHQSPWSVVRAFDDTLGFELIVRPQPPSVLISTAGGSDPIAVDHTTFMHVVLQTDGTLYHAPTAWSVSEGDAVELSTFVGGRDGPWVLVATTASSLSVPAPSGWLEIALSYDAETPQSHHMLALHLTPELNERGVDLFLDLDALGAVGIVERPTGGAVDVAAIVLTEVELETPSGPATLLASPALRLFRFGTDGLLADGPLATHPPLVDTLNSDDLQPDRLGQGAFPKFIPRRDGGFFLAMRLLGTRHFGDAPDRQTVPAPAHPTLVVASFESGGRLAWVRKVEGVESDDPFDEDFGFAAVAFLARADGSLVLGGGVTSALDIDGGDETEVTLESSDTSRDGFIVIWDRTGSLRLAEVVVRGPGRGWVTALAEDLDGALYFAGETEGPTELGVGGSAGNLDPQGYAGFISRVNSAGGLDCR